MSQIAPTLRIASTCPISRTDAARLLGEALRRRQAGQTQITWKPLLSGMKAVWFCIVFHGLSCLSFLEECLFISAPSVHRSLQAPQGFGLLTMTVQSSVRKLSSNFSPTSACAKKQKKDANFVMSFLTIHNESKSKMKMQLSSCADVQHVLIEP